MSAAADLAVHGTATARRARRASPDYQKAWFAAPASLLIAGVFLVPLLIVLWQSLMRDGISIEGYQRLLGSRAKAQAKAAATAVTAGADCFVIDAEAELEGRYAVARTYMKALRKRIGPDFPLLTSEYFTISLPQNNPLRRTAWTHSYKDEPSGRWVVSAITPLDLDGRHVATFGNDVLVDELLSRTLVDHLPGGQGLHGRPGRPGVRRRHPHPAR